MSQICPPCFAGFLHNANNTLVEAGMRTLADRFWKRLGSLVLLLLAALSLAVTVKSYDPVALLGWLFCLAAVLTAGQPAPQATESDFL